MYSVTTEVVHTEAAPEFDAKLQDVAIIEGDPAKLEVKVSGHPPPEINWLLDGHEIKPSKDFGMKFDGEKAVLTIKEACPEDSGVYSCRVTNKLGTQECSAALNVS